MATAGCLGVFGDDVFVDDTIDEGMMYEIDLEADTTLVIELTYEGDEDADSVVGVILRDSDQSIAFNDGTQEASAEFEYEVTESGSYSLQINPSGEFAAYVYYE